MPSVKDIDKLIKQMRGRGFECTQTRSSHWRCRYKKARDVIVPATPSRYSSIPNSLADAKRAMRSQGDQW